GDYVVRVLEVRAALEQCEARIVDRRREQLADLNGARLQRVHGDRTAEVGGLDLLEREPIPVLEADGAVLVRRAVGRRAEHELAGDGAAPTRRALAAARSCEQCEREHRRPEGVRAVLPHGFLLPSPDRGPSRPWTCLTSRT